jgi:hypothetical protein
MITKTIKIFFSQIDIWVCLHKVTDKYVIDSVYVSDPAKGGAQNIKRFIELQFVRTVNGTEPLIDVVRELVRLKSGL